MQKLAELGEKRHHGPNILSRKIYLVILKNPLLETGLKNCSGPEDSKTALESSKINVRTLHPGQNVILNFVKIYFTNIFEN